MVYRRLGDGYFLSFGLGISLSISRSLSSCYRGQLFPVYLEPEGSCDFDMIPHHKMEFVYKLIGDSVL